MPFLRKILSVLFVAALISSSLGADSRRSITEKDFLKFKWVADPEISPDGGQVAYVLVTVNEKDDGYETSIWLVPTSGAAPPRQITAGPHDSAPRWSPDGRTLALLRVEAKNPAQIYLLPMTGGEARRLTDMPEGASPAAWSPDGRTIAFTSETTLEQLKLKKESKEPEKKSDVRVITRAIYRWNGEGYFDPTTHAHIWTVSVPPLNETPGDPKQITSGKYDEENPQWSRDGSRIYFISDRVDEPYYYPPHQTFYSVPAAGGEPSTVIDINGPVSQVAQAPSEGRFAFVGFLNPPQEQSHTESRVFVVSSGNVKSLTADYDYEIGNDVGGDQAPPRGGGREPLVWSGDGRWIFSISSEKGRSNVVRIDAASGKVEHVTSGNHAVLSLSASRDAQQFAVVMSDATHLTDLYELNPANGALTQLTHVNDELFSGLRLPEPEEIWYKSFDGRDINGWILKPPDFDSSKKYPMILEIHGGPHGAYGWIFMHEFQWMAAKGYVVLYTNPRGSTSYGQEFANIIQYHYPGDDYKDLMIGVDEVLKRGYVDEKKLGVTGGSGGGLLTNWTVTQTDRFAAAVSQRSVADWSAFFYSADFTLFTPMWFRSTPFHDPNEFLERSPVRFAEKIHTPLMLIEGESDYRTPPSQGGEAMFRALKAQHKTTVMVRFPGETHELSRSGKPQHRIARLQHILNWFDKYLQGADIHLYDLQ